MAVVSLVALTVIAAVYNTLEKAMAQYPTTANACPSGVHPALVYRSFCAHLHQWVSYRIFILFVARHYGYSWRCV